MSAETIEIPLVIDGKEIFTGDVQDVRYFAPARLLLARARQDDRARAAAGDRCAAKAHRDWAGHRGRTGRACSCVRRRCWRGPTGRRSTRRRCWGRARLPTRPGIDSACELIDFFRFNVHFAEPFAAGSACSSSGMWNMMEPRPLEGFVFAATPFNFTAIAGNLPAAPALMGNTVVWKPSALAPYSAHFVMKLLREAGLPDGVINLVNGPPAPLVNACLDHPDLAGVHFTGSTPVFQMMWRRVGENMARYKCYPRLVGETGGKDFVFAHRSANVEGLAVALVRGAYEYQGQKCSAASRAYIPRSLWPALKARMVELIASIKIGDVADFTNFMGAVIGGASFERMVEHIELAKNDAECSVVAGGWADKSKGWFVGPTLVETTNPRHVLMEKELFGPLLCVWVYPDEDEEKVLELCDATSPYALTGAVFADDRAFVARASKALRFAAGNFYINDKPTGAVVGQQPFGGGRASGTNDKAGSALNLYRWVSPRTVKETFVPPTTLGYPFMGAE
ncbi:MAG: L-glutamate gamma-semialdehyde dehydrogenase [Polyangiaceae bacterium]